MGLSMEAEKTQILRLASLPCQYYKHCSGSREKIMFHDRPTTDDQFSELNKDLLFLRV